MRQRGRRPFLRAHIFPFYLILTNLDEQTPDNFRRAYVWTAVITALSHVDPNFSSVVSLEAINEPIMDASKTPDLGKCTSSYVLDFLACP